MSLATKQLSTPVLLSAKPHRACRLSTTCKATISEDGMTRRQSLALLSAVPLLLSLKPMSAQAVDLADKRKAKGGLDSLDQARDDDDDYRRRFSFQGGDGENLSLDAHKKRAKESFARLQKDVKKAIDDKAYPRVSADIRHQLGTLRFDLSKVAGSQDKTARKESLKIQKTALDALAELDFAARKNNSNKVQESYATAVKAFGDVISNLG